PVVGVSPSSAVTAVLAAASPAGFSDAVVGSVDLPTGLVFTPNPDPDTGGTFHSNIGRITPRGDITEFRVDCDCFLDDIVQGPDALYFTNNDFGRLGRITTAGAVSFISPQDSQGNPIDYILGGGIASHGSDLWGASAFRDVLWRYNVSTGAFTQFPAANPGDIAVDADGIVWFTAPGAIGRFDPATGTTTSTPVSGASLTHIAIAADRKVWFTDRINDTVGYLDPANSNRVSQFPTLTPEAGPQDIAAAPDGSTWFAQANVGNAARITAEGVITEAGKASGDDPDSGFENALGIAVRPDPDGLEGPEGESVWFTMEAANKVAALR
ncbi:MAG: virginiamycin B lyase family protein, partial [Stackebrandtia sp.]